ncbi:MAG: PHP domain-containing protein [Holophaga sp.]
MIDLHTHSIFSDGTDHPEALVRVAADLELTALALTDHDTLDGLDCFMTMQPFTSTLLVPGIELSCTFMGRPLHLLGLFLDFRDARLRHRVEAQRLRRLERNQAMVERLRARSVPITWDEVAMEAPTDLISRTHFARVLVRNGAAGSPEDAYRRLIGDDCPCYVPFPELTPAEGAAWIREAGGVAVVAHPGRGFPRGFRWDQAMLDLKAQGVQGFEAYYPDYGPQEQAYFLRLAGTLGMAPSGGSDHHGDRKGGRALGQGAPDDLLRGLQALRPA